MFESNYYRKYLSSIGNIIPTGVLENPIELSIFLVGESFLLLKLLFSYWIKIFNGKYLTCQVKHSKNKMDIYSLDIGLLHVIDIMDFSKTAS